MGKLQKDQRLRRLYMSYIDDGILDIFVGFMAIFACLIIFADMIWMAGVYVAILLPTVWSIKEKVTMPRLRREELSSDTTKHSTNMLGAFIVGLLLFMVLGVLFFLLFQNGVLMPLTREVFLPIGAGLIAAAILGGFLIVGSIYHAPRWYAYAAVTLAVGALAWWLGIELPWVIATIGAMMVVTGTFYLVGFLRSHPILPEEERPAW